jgi:hypothetical protein
MTVQWVDVKLDAECAARIRRWSVGARQDAAGIVREPTS